MKKSINYLLFICLLLISFSCSNDNDLDEMGYKQEMREFVIGISQYTRSIHYDFIIIPQNGIELVTEGGDEVDEPCSEYLSAIDGHGQEDLFFGYDNDDEPTPTETTQYLQTFLNISKASGNSILVTDYCSTLSNMDESYVLSNAAGYISFAADQRELNNIPLYPLPIYNSNSDDILVLEDAKNFLYLINPENYDSKDDFINAITSTNYDLLIMDLFFHDGTEFTQSEIIQLKNKANGGTRLLICYMSIGEAEYYRYYWQSEWDSNPPGWLDEENPNWAGNYKVKYWNSEWQAIIFGNENSYSKKILEAGFDGVYLDIIDAFEYYE
ncbi:MAG: endo alpha-1,4 polygalactosaminidase [Candidatus Tenebribacter davisii]|nr:endo alpha-1,4 polygalactosaminidase [Candidatus Tenebribacter davisii]